MSINLPNNAPQEIDSPEQQGRPDRYPFLHRLAKSARTAILLAAGAVLGNAAAGCSDQNPTPETPEFQSVTTPSEGSKIPDDADPAKIETAVTPLPKPPVNCDAPQKLSILDNLDCITKDLFDRNHPQSIIGQELTLAEQRQYLYKLDVLRKPINKINRELRGLNEKLQKLQKLKRTKSNRNAIGQLNKKIKSLEEDKKRATVLYLKQERSKRLGAITFFERSHETARRHIAVGSFLSDVADKACATTELAPDECLLYHVMLWENSGGLWKRSKVGAVGAGQIMPSWFDYEKNLPDKLETEGFFRLGPKKNRTFDGRYDPVTNAEIGARILKESIRIFGRNHPDFAILAYNQGDPNVKTLIKNWALKHKKLSFEDFEKKWRRENPSQRFQFSYFIDKVGASLAEMLRDEDLAYSLMPSSNGGRQYLSRIVATQMVAREPGIVGIKHMRVNLPPVESDENGNIKYKWGDLYEGHTLPSGISLKEFAEQNGYKPKHLIYINKQIRNPNLKFNRPLRIWLPRSPFPENIRGVIATATESTL